jgi:endoglucanase
VVNGLFDPALSLRTIEPLADPAVIYAFQFYDPYIVTHQGADWDPGELGGVSVLRDVPYPAARLDNPWTIAARAWFHPRAVRLLIDYRRQGWNAARIEGRIAQAAAWSAHHARPVLCTEFGVMRSYIDTASRLAWLGDVRAAFDRHGIAWTVWEYDGLFGIVPGSEEHPGETAPRPLEPGPLRALGLDRDGARTPAFADRAAGARSAADP